MLFCLYQQLQNKKPCGMVINCACAEAVEEEPLTQAADEEAIAASKKAMMELKKTKEKEAEETKRILRKRTLELGECGSSEDEGHGGTPKYVEGAGAPKQDLPGKSSQVPRAAKTKAQKPPKHVPVPEGGKPEIPNMPEGGKPEEALPKVHPKSAPGGSSKECPTMQENCHGPGDNVARKINFETEAAAMIPQNGLLGSSRDYEDTQRDEPEKNNGDKGATEPVPRHVATPQAHAPVVPTDPESQASFDGVRDCLNRANTGDASEGLGGTPQVTPIASVPSPAPTALPAPPLLEPPLRMLSVIPPLPPAHEGENPQETAQETKKGKKQRTEDEKKIHAKRMCFYRSLESTVLRLPKYLASFKHHIFNIFHVHILFWDLMHRWNWIRRCINQH